MAVEALPQLERARAGEARRTDWPELADVLLAGERVLFLTRGRVRAGRMPRPARWFVLVTDQRLICLRDSRRAARQQLHVTLNLIEHAYQRGLLGGKVIVVTRRGRIRISGLGRYAGGELVARLLSYSRGADAMLPGAAPEPALLPTAVPQEALISRVEELESVIDRMTQHLRFLEELLRARQGAAG